MGAALGIEFPEEYERRLRLLAEARIAVWDLVASCERKGSLDVDIRDAILNPIREFIIERPQLERIALNGGRAAALFSSLAPEIRPKAFPLGQIVDWRLDRPVEPDSKAIAEAFSPSGKIGRTVFVARLPSTSPVPTAAFRKASDKIALWSAFVGPAKTEVQSLERALEPIPSS